jgi:threonine/homoserine/homoserine lactone efflux protein
VLLALVTGSLLGLLVAAQVGPIWLLCARSSLRHGARVGLAIGAGAAVVDTLYAMLGALGAARLVTVSALRPVLGLVGAGVLFWIGGRTLWSAFRVRTGGEADDEVASARSAFTTAVAATASNPLTIASWAAIFAAASIATVASTPARSGALVAGVALGSFLWFAVLSVALGLLGRRVGPRTLQWVDGLSGAGIVAFGGVLGWRSLRQV